MFVYICCPFLATKRCLSRYKCCSVLQAAANADERLRLREQQQSHAIRQLQQQPRQQQYPHTQPVTSPPVPNGRNSFLHVPQPQSQQPSAYHHGYPANFTATGSSPVSSSTSPVRSHSPVLSPMAPAYTHHHLAGSFTLPANLALHGNRQHQATVMGQDTSRQNFYHISQGGNGLAQTYTTTSTTMATQPRGWSAESTMVSGPQSMVGWNSQPQPCGQPLLACRGQDEP